MWLNKEFEEFESKYYYGNCNNVDWEWVVEK